MTRYSSLHERPTKHAAGSELEPGREALRVVIVQAAAQDAQSLAGYFNKRRDQVWQTHNRLKPWPSSNATSPTW